MKVAAYVRVSSQEQFEHGFSIRAQEDKLISFAESQDWEVVKVYREEGRSAKDMERPALKQLLADMKNSTFDVVLVHKLDRLTRSVLDANKILQQLEQYDVSFKSATEPYDTTTAQGKMFLNIMASLAQFEREQLAERVKFGMEQSAKEGKWSGGHSPLGYDYKEGEFRIVEGEAKIVREIFELIKSNGLNRVADKLNERGYRTKKGARFTAFTVQYIMNNPIYMGKVRFNSSAHRFNDPMDKQTFYDSEIPPILSEDEFMNAYNIMSKRRTKGTLVSYKDYIFSGVLRCYRCGGAMNGNRYTNSKGQVKTYRCPNKDCDMARVQELKIEEALLSNIDEYMNEWIGNNTIEESNEVNNESIKKEIQTLQKRMSKYKEMFVNDLIGIDELNQNVYALRQQEKELQHQLQPKQDIDTSTLQLINSFPTLWSEANNDEKTELIQSIFTRIYIDSDDTKPTAGRPKPVFIKRVE